MQNLESLPRLTDEERELANAIANAIDLEGENPPCSDCGSTDAGHATPCGRREPTEAFRAQMLVAQALAVLATVQGDHGVEPFRQLGEDQQDFFFGALVNLLDQAENILGEVANQR